MINLFFLMFMSVISFDSFAKTVYYELEATQLTVNLSGKNNVDFALAINNQIPAPALFFTEGDDAEILVKNKIPNQELSIHWHGILLPPEMDGVPYVTTPPIKFGESFLFKFKIRQNGTYWYHSHTDVQEQKGLYGAIVIHPKNNKIKYDTDIVAVISDWSDENPTNILKNLKKDGDYYLFKKKTVRSIWGALINNSLGNYFYNEWTRMGGMDYSDVGYDAFLINGKRNLQLGDLKAGTAVRLRIINASASTYFYFTLGQSPLNIISYDGIDIQPTNSYEILSGMAETHDILFKIPDEKNYQFKVTAQDGTGVASGWLGNSKGTRVYAPVKKLPDLYATMDHSSMDHSTMDHSTMDHSTMDHSNPTDESSLIFTVNDAKSLDDTSFKSYKKKHELQLVLDGDMERYIWHINGKTISQDKIIKVDEGDVVNFTFVNKTMMHHPMHLHGHFFRVLNKFDTHSPLKHTVDVSPHSSRTIEFLTNEPGQWMLHCHNLYHLKTGMARLVEYSTYKPSTEIQKLQKHDPHDHDHWYFYGKILPATNYAQAFLRLSQTWNQIEFNFESHNKSRNTFKFDSEWENEADLFYKRFYSLSNYFHSILGLSYYDDKLFAAIGFGYTLPFLIESQFIIDHKANIRVKLEKKFQWTENVFSATELKWKSDTIKNIDYLVTLMYQNSWNFAIGTVATTNSIGFGGQIQF